MKNAKLNSLIQDYENDLVETLSRLIAVKSVNSEPKEGKPFGEGPAEVLNLALQMAADMGFSTQNLDNYVGVVDLNDQETRLAILCHLDVVGEGSGWSSPPYEATRKDDMLYGRGAIDNKGPATAALFALKAVKDLKLPLKFNVRLILGTAEEIGGPDINHYLESHQMPPYTFAPDDAFPVINTEKGGLRPSFHKTWEESTDLPRILLARGGERNNVIPDLSEAVIEGLSLVEAAPYCDEFSRKTGVSFVAIREENGVRINALGKSEHASTPEKGNNSVTAMLEFLSALPLADCEAQQTIKALSRMFPHRDYYGKAAGISQEDEISGPLTLSFNIFEMDLQGFKGRFDSRTPLCATQENSADVIRQRFESFGVEMEGRLSPPHHTPCDSEFVQTLLKVYEEHTGNQGYCKAIGGGTYVHSIKGGVCFGAAMPGFEGNMHGADEHVSIPDLLVAAEIFTQVIIEICE